jgi:multiple sugar transport system permease protein
MERGIVSRYDLKRSATRIVYGLVMLAVAAMVASMLYPIFVTFFNGLKLNTEVNSFPPRFLPTDWQWGNFQKGWDYIPLLKYLRSTLLIFAGNMIATVVVPGLASFSLSRMNVPHRNLFYYLFLMTLFIPPTTYIIPNFINLKDLGLLNTYYAFWLPAGANAFYLLLLKSFFDSLNAELFEAARIDGASELKCFSRIALPLSIPIFATLAIFIFASAWNDWFWPSLVMHSDDKYPLATAIYKYVINVRRLDTNIKFAILSMVMVPPIVIFLLFQRFIIRGLQIGSIKG